MLSAEQLIRYKRNILLAGCGEAGQERLLAGKVLLIGAGGLGSPAAYYLAAAGVGGLGLIDPDVVELSNLQRQILHNTGDLGRPKVDSAREKLLALNPDLKIEAVAGAFTRENAAALIARYDFVIDCTDNFPARYLLNEVCVRSGRPFVYGGVLAYAGQAMTIVPGRGPCLRCIFREAPGEGAPTTGQVGVLGAVPGVIGAIQATEAVKYLLGAGELLTGRLLTFDALTMTFFEAKVQRDPDCPVCGRKQSGGIA
ncbi:MAG: HesA/MoeB/ThiF family protein [Armatimonadetes bacterium]|nr:HesA/MoeB/ThiF family protein [Armatimonadota bacterium]